jgi:hypothetical protein
MAEGTSSRTDLTAIPRTTANLTFAIDHRVAPGARQAESRRGAATTPEGRSFRDAISLGSQLRMGDHRVVAAAVEQGTAHPPDPHVAAICLEDGRRIPKARAITNLRYGVERYFTEVAGVRAHLRVVDPCSRCGEAFLRADEAATLPDQLMGLPPCSEEERPSPSGSEAAILPPPQP